MARRKESFFDTLVLLPWWVGLLVGGLGLIVLDVVLPAIWTDPMLGGIAKGLKSVGPFFFGICALAALVSAIRRLAIRRTLDKQSGIESIRQLSWQRFEMIIGEVFRRMGYSVVENGLGGADGGVDLVLDRDGVKFFVQCKQWKAAKVGVKPVRELAGVMSARKVSHGFFVTSGTYTDAAREFAAEADISLIDGISLGRLVGEVQKAPSDWDATSWRQTDVRDTSEHPECPRCGKAMVHRTAKRGAHAGKGFWGCPTFPACKGTREIEA
jgi:restriction system protein